MIDRECNAYRGRGHSDYGCDGCHEESPDNAVVANPSVSYLWSGVDKGTYIQRRPYKSLMIAMIGPVIIEGIPCCDRQKFSDTLNLQQMY
jgi:hypothetical protein